MPPLEGDTEEFDMLSKESDEEGKKRKSSKSCNTKQTVNQAPNITSTSKSWKQFMQIRKQNQINKPTKNVYINLFKYS